MILFPRQASASERYILLMYLEHDRNKKMAAYYSGVSIRRAQEVTKKWEAWLNGYRATAISRA